MRLEICTGQEAESSFSGDTENEGFSGEGIRVVERREESKVNSNQKKRRVREREREFNADGGKGRGVG